MKLNIKQLTGPQFFVEVENSSSVLSLKQKIFESQDIPVFAQRLIYSGRELVDDQLISSYNLDEGRTIHLVMRRQLSSSTSYGTSISNANLQSHTVVLPSNTDNINLSENKEENIDNNRDNASGPIDIESQENEPLNPNENNLEANDNAQPHSVDVMDIARMCRLIRLFAIIDCVLMILFAFWGDLLFLCGVPLAICGYFGAKSLKRGPLFIYGIFILLSIAFRVYLAYLYSTWLMILLAVISVLLELYIFKQTITVFAIIPQLSNNDRRVLNQLSDMFI